MALDAIVRHRVAATIVFLIIFPWLVPYQALAINILIWGLFALGFALPVSVKQRPLSADGEFGSETDKAVRLFQRQQGLAADGIAGQAGPQSQAALREVEDAYQALMIVAVKPG